LYGGWITKIGGQCGQAKRVCCRVEGIPRHIADNDSCAIRSQSSGDRRPNATNHTRDQSRALGHANTLVNS
jgi:hypothetical protein